MKMYEVVVSPLTLDLLIKVLGKVRVVDESFSIKEKLMIRDMIDLFRDARESADADYCEEVIRSGK